VSSERVLHVVIDGVAAEIAGELSVEQAFEIGERRAELVDRPPGQVREYSSSTARRTAATELTCTVFVTS